MERRDFLKLSAAGISTIMLADPVGALTASSKSNKWVVIYGTWCGSTRDAAGWINEGMGNIADVVDVEDNPDLSKYESVVIGGAIQGGATSTKLQNFISSNKTALKDKIRGLFIVCGNMGNATIGSDRIKMYMDDHLKTITGVKDKPSKVFPGRLAAGCEASASLLKSMGAFDNLKKDDCKAFGQEITQTSVEIVRNIAPQRFELFQNSPNPFNPITTIQYSIPKAVNVSLTVSSLSGRKLATLVSGYQQAGNYLVNWNGKNLAPGYYLYRLEAGSFVETRTAKRVGR